MILVTGGAGYIGTHTLVSLFQNNYDFIVYDNLSNASQMSLQRVEKIIRKPVIFEKGDIRDRVKLQSIFRKYDITSVIHLAGLKAVGESVHKPLEYYDNNINGTLVILSIMQEFNCKKIVFSSSATVYGDPKCVPIKESFAVGHITNPYGRTKYFIEEILKDLNTCDSAWKIAILRYFNPVGAHESGLIGENPNGIPNNLMPLIAQTAVGKRKILNVYGGDYDTTDGTGVRDYIHVVDLAEAHVKAIQYLDSCNENIEPLFINIGTGKGYSVLEMIQTFEQVSKRKIPYRIVDRRSGDIAKCYADSSFANKILHWKVNKTVEDMCKDSWNWQKNNPNGYKSG